MNSSKKLDQVWQVMIGTYGQAFISVHGIDPSPIWDFALRDIGPYRLQSALDGIMDGTSGYLDFPPNAPAFAAYARSLQNVVPPQPVQEMHLLEKKPQSEEEKEAARLAAEKAREELRLFLKTFGKR